jgi:hypothetical protein
MTMKQVYEALIVEQADPKMTVKHFLSIMTNQEILHLDFVNPTSPLISPPKLSRHEAIIALLAESEKPLTLDEIINRGRSYFGIKQAGHFKRSVAAILNRYDEFYLLGQASFGLRKHFVLPEAVWPKARSDFKKVLQHKKRPVSTIEVVRQKQYGWTELTNEYEITHVLKEDPSLIYLGRFLFALKAWSINERENIKDIIYRVMRDASRPLTSKEIYNSVLRERYVAPTSISTILRADTRFFDSGFGYFSLKNDKLDPSYFLENHRLIGKLIARLEPPLTLGNLLEKLGIKPQSISEDKEVSGNYWTN